MTAHKLPTAPPPAPGPNDPLAAALADVRLSWTARGILAFVRTRPPGQIITLRGLLGVTPAAAVDESVEHAVAEIAAAGYPLREVTR